MSLVNTNINFAVSKPHFLPEVEDSDPAEDVDYSKEEWDQADEVCPGADIIVLLVSVATIVVQLVPFRYSLDFGKSLVFQFKDYFLKC